METRNTMLLISLAVIIFQLIVITFALQGIITTINDKGINVHMHQKITADHCTWDVKTRKGTIINMNSVVSEPKTLTGG